MINKMQSRFAMLATFAGLSFAVGCLPPAAAETHIVEMRGLEFSPAIVEAAPGDTITWVNRDVMPHTATAEDGSWDSGLMEEGDEWSLVIEQADSIDYVCSFHPTMTGRININ